MRCCFAVIVLALTAGYSTVPAQPAEAVGSSVQGVGEVTYPVLLRNVDPIYPSGLRRDGVQATVKLRAKVKVDGTVGEIETIDCVSHSPFDPPVWEVPVRRCAEFEKAAKKAAAQRRYAPATINGAPVDVPFEITIDFRIKSRKK